MLAKLSDDIPEGDGWLYEPKWDGFRCIVVRDGDTVELTSRNERPFTRYFPELLGPLRDQLPDGCVIDGEIVLPATQAGSSIMPGKINPVIPEVVNQVAFEVIGNDMTVTMAAEGGQLQLNAFEPVIAYRSEEHTSELQSQR